MNLNDRLKGHEAVSKLLCSTQLDTIRVYSLILQLGFLRLRAEDNLPRQVWVSASGRFMIEGAVQDAGGSHREENFFSQRASVLAAMYKLIGQRVVFAGLSDSCALEINIGSTRLLIDRDDESLEEVWSVASDSPDATLDHDWSVSLDDSNEISVRVPT